jgi:hypothetical protein
VVFFLSSKDVTVLILSKVWWELDGLKKNQEKQKRSFLITSFFAKFLKWDHQQSNRSLVIQNDQSIPGYLKHSKGDVEILNCITYLDKYSQKYIFFLTDDRSLGYYFNENIGVEIEARENNTGRYRTRYIQNAKTKKKIESKRFIDYPMMIQSDGAKGINLANKFAVLMELFFHLQISKSKFKNKVILL